jgi:hypothetical protein
MTVEGWHAVLRINLSDTVERQAVGSVSSRR